MKTPKIKTPPRGHIILVVTPNEGAQPSYRAYLVAENDPLKARSLVARHIHTDEIAYTLAAFPDVLQQIAGQRLTLRHMDVRTSRVAKYVQQAVPPGFGRRVSRPVIEVRGHARVYHWLAPSRLIWINRARASSASREAPSFLNRSACRLSAARRDDLLASNARNRRSAARSYSWTEVISFGWGLSCMPRTPLMLAGFMTQRGKRRIDVRQWYQSA